MHCSKLFELRCDRSFRTRRFCSPYCATQAPERAEQIRQTTLKNHGVKNIFMKKEVREKAKASSRSAEARHKRETTSIANYGVSNPMKNPVVKKRVADTQRKNNDGRLAFNTEKQRRTMRERYGVEVPAKNPEIASKIKATQQKNHDGRFAFNTEKQRSTMIEKYGVPANGLRSFRSTSTEEKSIAPFLESLGLRHNVVGVKGVESFRFSDGRRKVPDFVSSKLKVVVEYNGSYWHSDPSEPEYWSCEWSRLGFRVSVVWDFELKDFLDFPPADVENLLEKYPCTFRRPGGIDKMNV